MARTSIPPCTNLIEVHGGKTPEQARNNVEA